MKRKQPEKEIQAQIVRLLRSLGADVYVIGTRRRKGDYQGTMQSPGIPDLEVFMPVPRLRPMDLRRMVKIEVKAPEGRMTEQQQYFRQLCLQANVAHITGGLDEVFDWLILNGYLESSQIATEKQKAP